jgi:hypothetical protein
MTLPLSGNSISLEQINLEYKLGLSLDSYLGQYFFTVANSFQGYFSTDYLAFSSFYGTAKKVIINLTISSNTANYNPLLNTNEYVAGISEINITINPGVYVYSTSPGNPALNISGLALGDTVNIINDGLIYGAGGIGGKGGYKSNSPTAGGQGGTAIKTTFPITITNNGTIAGGGGGGGADAGDSSYNGCASGSYTYYYGGGGGGGAGFSGGVGGTQYNGTSSGSTGGLTTGGAGGNGTNGSKTLGGAGGNLGASGGLPQSGSSGGLAGYYIDGVALTTWAATGTRLGLFI